MDRDCINRLAQAPHRQNRQHQSLAQIRSNRYSGCNQAERDLENNQLGDKQLETDILMKHNIFWKMLERIEQEIQWNIVQQVIVTTIK